MSRSHITFRRPRHLRQVSLERDTARLLPVELFPALDVLVIQPNVGWSMSEQD